MKKIFTLVFISCVSLTALAQYTYTGNQATGFGGFVGKSSLVIEENGTNLNFTITKGAGANNFNDALVLYLDVIAGTGETSTSTYTDVADPSRRAISGLSTGGRSIINFPGDFGADFAIVVDAANTFAGLFSLNNTGSFTYVQSAGISPLGTGNSAYTFSIAKANIGYSNTSAAFRFSGTYLNDAANSTFRSNEGFGTLTFAGIADANGNPGYNTTTATVVFTYPIVLPLKLLSFSGNVVDNRGKLTWQAANDNEIKNYELEKSIDGKKFVTLQTINALRTSALQTYTVEDANLSGTNLYRLKSTDLQGIIDYSKIVQLSIGVKGQGFTIFPNPVQQTLNIKMAKLEKGRYDVNVYNAAGQMVFAKAIQYDGSGNTLQVELPANIQRGNYNCILSNTTGRFTSSFLKQ